MGRHISSTSIAKHGPRFFFDLPIAAQQQKTSGSTPPWPGYFMKIPDDGVAGGFESAAVERKA
jgi:hypothetical protein